MGNGSSNAVSQRLENASKTGVLSLRELRLDQLPPGVSELKSSLRTLDITFNNIQLLPDNIGEFNKLKTLASNNNKLGTVPPSLGELKRLETLHLQFNLIHSFSPSSLSSLSSLKTLDISHNRLASLPPQLYTLPHLDYLNVSHNSLQCLHGDGVETLAVLELNLSSNSIPSLPKELGMCRRLKVLRVEENSLQLAGIPRELLEESKISLLCLRGNLFQDKDLQDLPGYQKYMERFTATRKKIE